MRRNILSMAALAVAAAFTLTSCLSDGDDTIVLEDGNTTGIPGDDQAGPNPTIDNQTTTIPNITTTLEGDGSTAIARIDMTGVQEGGGYDWLRLVGTGQGGQNVWVEVDGKPKGIAVVNNADNEGSDKTRVDLVFLVDNSGSMGNEADAIARDITSWSQGLAASGIDIRFGCVGYGYHVGAQFDYLKEDYGVSGALDITTSAVLDEFLNGRGKSGTARTVGYYGERAGELKETAETYDRYRLAGGECGVQALWFADEQFNFRDGANRIYVNFTDDANFPATNDDISIYSVIGSDAWTTDKGTIHSVISDDTTTIKQRGEAPWLLSRYTGGTIITAPSDFSGVTLASLPVTGAMQNSYIIRFTNIGEFLDGQPHLVKITILSPDGKTKAERTFYVTFGTV